MGAVIKDEQGRLLLFKRGREPGGGLWSLPGGRIEPGETDAEALVREMREETGLAVEAGRLPGSVWRPTGDGNVPDIRDYAATVRKSSPVGVFWARDIINGPIFPIVAGQCRLCYSMDRLNDRCAISFC